MTLQRNHYEVLGVPRKATTDEIKKKYRELARKFHPDIAADKAMGQTIFSQINQAYRVLGDPDRRAQYDAAMAADTAAPARNGVAANNAASNRGNGISASNSPNAQDTANIVRLLDEAETAMLQNNVGKVKAICDKVLETDPRSQKAFGLLGDALLQMGRPQEAAAAYRQALEIAPNIGIQAKLGRLQSGVPKGNGAPAPPMNDIPPRTPSPANGNGGMGQDRPNQGRGEKSGGNLFSRLLGKR